MQLDPTSSEKSFIFSDTKDPFLGSIASSLAIPFVLSYILTCIKLFSLLVRACFPAGGGTPIHVLFPPWHPPYKVWRS